MANDVISLFMKVGLTEQRAKETAKNEALSQTLKEVILQVCELRVYQKSQEILSEFIHLVLTLCFFTVLVLLSWKSARKGH